MINGEDTELFQIIDETGEGWGFDLTPATVRRPLAAVSATLLGIGMLAGIPAGIWAGRVQLSTERSNGDININSGINGRKVVKPTMEGVFFAAKAFAYGTALCGAFGYATFNLVKWYYQVDSFEEFGRVMRDVVPEHRDGMESGLSPAITRIRSYARENLPAPLANARVKFEQSRPGIWFRQRVADASSLIIIEDDQGDGE